MGCRPAMGLLVLCACNGAHLNEGGTDGPTKKIDGGIDSPAMIDAPPDALPPWSALAMVPGAANTTMNIDDETLNSTQTEMYFGIIDATLGVKQLWMMSRASAADPWGAPVEMDATFNVGGTTPPTEESPRLSPDDTKLYFGRGGDIYYATRASNGATWGAPVALASVNTAAYEKWLAVCDNDYFLVSRDGGTTQGQDLYEGQLGTGVGTVATELNSTSNEISTFLSKDCMTTYFASNRSGTTMIYRATRMNPTATWTSPTMVTDFGTTYEQEDPWISNDGLAFYMASERFGSTNTNKGIYCSTR